MLLMSFFLQLCVLPSVMGSFGIDLIFLFIVSLSLVYSFHENIYIVVLGGFIMDLFSSVGFGIFTISLLCIALIIDLVRHIILPERRGTLLPFMFIALSRVLYDSIVYFLAWFFAYYRLSSVSPLNPAQNIIRYMMLLIVSSVAGLLVYKAVDKLERSFGKGRMDLKITNS